MTQQVISHACEYETSLMLAIRPDLVFMDRTKVQKNVLENDWFVTDNDARKCVAVFRRFTASPPMARWATPPAALKPKAAECWNP